MSDFTFLTLTYDVISEMFEVKSLPSLQSYQPRIHLRDLVFLVSWDGVRLSPLITSAAIRSIVPAPDDR
jgi:hypothetical protein